MSDPARARGNGVAGRSRQLDVRRMASTGARADAARAAFRERLDARGHAVENVRAGVADLEQAIADGVLTRTPLLEQMLGDLLVALEQDDGQKLGGKSAEAARFIGRAIARELEHA